MRAYNNPNDDGDWSFSVGSQNSSIGFWQPYIGYSNNFDGANREVVVGTEFVTWDGYFRPGDQLCSSTFNFQSSSNNANYVTNVQGLRFEGGGQVNNLPSVVYAINNGILDVNMRKKADNHTGSRSPLRFLKNWFQPLFESGDIKPGVENGQKIWNFSPYAAAKIATFVSNITSNMLTTELGPTASIPENSAVWLVFYERASQLLSSLIPGSVIRQGYIGNATNSTAVYAPLCQ